MISVLSSLSSNYKHQNIWELGQPDSLTVRFRIQPLLSCRRQLLRISEKNYSGPADCPSPEGAAAARTIRCRHFAIGALENSRWSYKHLYLSQRSNTVISDVTDLRLQVRYIAISAITPSMAFSRLFRLTRGVAWETDTILCCLLWCRNIRTNQSPSRQSFLILF